MQSNVSLFDSQSAFLRAVNFKFVNNFLQAHICFEPLRQIYLAIGALFSSKLAEAGFAQDCSTLVTIEWRFRKFKAHNALQLFKT